MNSNSKRTFRVTHRAKKDLINIAKYTERTWGKVQRNQYLKNLENRFNWLSNYPFSGKHRAEIHKLYYSYPQGQHVVFYLISENAIDIIGIPHKDMDIIGYFQLM